MNSIRSTSLLLVTTILVSSISFAHAQSFIDDFSTDQVSRSNFQISTSNLANPDSVATYNGSELAVSIQHSDPSNLDERASFEVKPVNRPDIITSTGMFTGQRPDAGALRYEMEGNFFNRIEDGGPNSENREGDVEVDLVISLAANPADDFAAYCIFERDSEDSRIPVNGGDDNCGSFNSTVELDTPYIFSAGVDKSTNQIIAQLNDERIVVDYQGEYFEPMRENSVFTRFRVREGASSGNFSFSSIAFNSDDQVSLLAVANPSPYRQDDFDFYDDNPSLSKEVVNGQLKLSATNSDPNSNATSQLRLRNNTPFIGGDLTYASESVEDQTGEGFQSVRFGGLLYNELSEDDDADLTGSVFAAVSLIKNSSTALVGEYCLIRSNDGSFNTTVDLADGMDDDRCPTFDLPVMTDTSYSASVALDPEAKTVTFTLGGEEKVVNVTSDIYIREGENLRAQARIAAGATGTIVGFVDNVTNSADIFNMATPTESGGASGSGCSIGGGGSSVSFMLVMSAFTMLLALRRRLLGIIKD